MDHAKRSSLVLSIAGMALAGCAAFGAKIKAEATKVATKILASVPTDVDQATKLWGIAKGIGLVALPTLNLVDPALAASVNLAMKAGDAIIAKLPVLEADAAALQTALSNLTANSQAILLAGAPQITATANADPTVPAVLAVPPT